MVRIPSADSDDESNDPGVGDKKGETATRKLKPLNDWAIIEMQGDLESRIGDVQLEGKFVGDLHFTKSGETPVLIIGHHILYGKLVKLEKPLVIMEKCQKQSTNPMKKASGSLNASGDTNNYAEKNDAMEIDDVNEIYYSEEPEKSKTVYNVRAIIKKKLLFKSRPKPIIANVPKKI